MHDCMTQEDAMNMDNKQAAQILIPLRDMMIDQHGCPISDAWFALGKAIDALSANQWIPCSERLPDIGEHHVSEPCLVYCDNGAYGFAELEENIFGQVGWNCERDDDYHEPLGTVIAWQPLPEPYQQM